MQISPIESNQPINETNDICGSFPVARSLFYMQTQIGQTLQNKLANDEIIVVSLDSAVGKRNNNSRSQ
jgi:hypothetical protein